MSAFQRVVVVGAGTMGQGIAQVCATTGLSVQLHDVDEKRAADALKTIGDLLGRSVQKGKITEEARSKALGLIQVAPDLAAASKDADLCIEAAPESMELKVSILATFVGAASPNALVGSNTSSLSITEMGNRIGAPDRTVGLHFFNPPPVMELLEIVRGFSTSSDSVDRAMALAAHLGKKPILVRDTPGFATSRLGVIAGVEAIRMLEAGVASVEDIDRAMELGYRHPMGPLKLGDLVGLDVRLNILDHLTKEIGDQFRPPPLLRQMVRAGKLGKKTGQGFYTWTPEGAVPNTFR